MEQLARALGLDPVEFRLRHLLKEGDPVTNGQPWQSNGAREVLRRIGEHPLWTSQWKASGGTDGRSLGGTGLAVGGWIPGLQPAGATVRLNPDGSVSVLTNATSGLGVTLHRRPQRAVAEFEARRRALAVRMAAWPVGGGLSYAGGAKTRRTPWTTAS